MSEERDQQFEYHRTASNRCGITMSSGVEGNAIADLMEDKPGVEIHRFPAMIRIDAEDRVEFDLDEIAEALGVDEFTPEDFEIETSTHYGRMVRLDDKILVFANPEDAAEHLGFKLPQKEQ